MGRALLSARASTTASGRPGRKAAVVNVCYGESRNEIVVDYAGRDDLDVLVMRRDARSSFLQRMRQSATTGSGGLFYVFRISAEIEC